MKIRRLGVRAAAILLAATGPSISIAAPAVADTTSTLTPTIEGWYQPNPACVTVQGCVTIANPRSPYPARTMHVGYSAGQETARTYLALPFQSVTGSLEAASLAIPLDTASADGSLQPETAKLQVCLVSAPITAVDGSMDKPPGVDCSASTPVTYVPSPSPHLQADLEPILSRLSNAVGLVLLPDATKAVPTDAWRVVFSAHDRTDALKTEPASLTLTIGTAAPAPRTGFETQPPTNVTNQPAAAVSNSTGFAAPPTTTPAPAAALTPRPGPVRSTSSTVGFAYPIVVMLPLALIILLTLAASQLTRDLYPTSPLTPHRDAR